ncbi:hypothetical protein Ancab_011043 [Ancistrocladus abbreviatus]
MADQVQGTVTSLSSLFPAGEALKASKRVQDTIAEKQKELDNLQSFIADNINLINLVQRLPNELHHQIMVPFGKAAFFPGSLIHTNELLVLLGEGYYAERTSKQTIEILKRRGKSLDAQVDSLKTMMEDLKVEASFFDATAAEAVEGLVDIREEYIVEDSGEIVSKTGNRNQSTATNSGAYNTDCPVEDEEYAHMMSRLDELEKEELAAENAEEQDEDEQDNADLDNLGTCGSDLWTSLNQDVRKLKDENSESEKDDGDKLNLERENFQRLQKGISSEDRILIHNTKLKSAEDSGITETVMSFQSVHKPKDQVSVQKLKRDAGHPVSSPTTDSFKAFTGSIIERTENLPSNPAEQTVTQAPGSHPAKPVSRFKMQRR